ncbi:MAG: NAD(P)H-hydrate dehydratase, partial [Planctomycetes bacterium]|nr:NAD(P)H-hydrate dehydratase [Planctomycetota bacterium]
HEIAPLPERKPDAHKGDAGRVVVIGGSCGEVMMVGAPAMTASAAFRTGSGLVQLFVPEALRAPVAVLSPCATIRTLPAGSEALLAAIDEFRADAVAVGPGLGRSIEPTVLVDLLKSHSGAVIIDADGLNLLAETDPFDIPDPRRIVLTPHLGELNRLLEARKMGRKVTRDSASRRDAACALVEAYGCTVVFKGRRTVVTNGDRLYVNETGNVGLATAGTGDVLTGILASLMGEAMPAFEASILGVYLHGLAGDFAAEELGRRSLTATDVIDYLPEALCDHSALANE